MMEERRASPFASSILCFGCACGGGRQGSEDGIGRARDVLGAIVEFAKEQRHFGRLSLDDEDGAV